MGVHLIKGYVVNHDTKIIERGDLSILVPTSPTCQSWFWHNPTHKQSKSCLWFFHTVQIIMLLVWHCQYNTRDSNFVSFSSSELQLSSIQMVSKSLVAFVSLKICIPVDWQATYMMWWVGEQGLMLTVVSLVDRQSTLNDSEKLLHCKMRRERGTLSLNRHAPD